MQTIITDYKKIKKPLDIRKRIGHNRGVDTKKESKMNDRKQQIQDIAAIYTNRFTAACMCDRLADEDRYCAAANKWMLEQKTAHNITNEELAEAIKTLQKKAEDEGQAFAYDKIVIMQ